MKTTLIYSLLLTLLLFSCNEPAPTAAKEETRGTEIENPSTTEDIIGHEIDDTLTQSSFPKPDGFVTDVVGVLSDEEEQKLEERLENYEQSTSREIAVAIVPNIGNYENIDEYGTALANAWGVGKKNKDNGLLITLAIELRKVRIDYGLGTEKVLSNEFGQQVINQHMVPALKMQDYSKALHKALDAIETEWS